MGQQPGLMRGQPDQPFLSRLFFPVIGTLSLVAAELAGKQCSKKQNLAPQAHSSRDGKAGIRASVGDGSLLMADGRMSPITKTPCLHQGKSRVKLP